METPKFCQTNAPLSIDAKTNDHFIIDYLLDFPNDDEDAAIAAADRAITDSTPVDTSSNSSFSTAEPHFPAADIGGPRSFVDGHSSNDLCVPYDDLAELEWLSRLTDESFSSEDLQKLQIIQGMKARTNEVPQAHQYQFQPGATRPGPVTAKARSKRSRAASGSWPSCFITATPFAAAPTMSSSEPDIVATATAKALPGKPAVHKKKEVTESSVSGGGDGRKCLHCATDKTPQWRTGPLGPKTLCNACGVRFKSGRLVPEYRPAASPTFVLTKHSNSHRKVLELRRQKEMVWTQQQFRHHHHHQPMVFDASNGDDFLIHQHLQPDFRQLI